MPTPERNQQLAWHVVKIGSALVVLASGNLVEAKSQPSVSNLRLNNPPISFNNQDSRLPSVQAFNQNIVEISGTVIKTEILQSNPWQLEFDIGSNHYLWDYTNVFGGIYPPNDPDRNTGTVRVTVNGVWDKSKDFQPLVTEELYPEIKAGPGVGVLVVGMAVNIPLDIFGLATGTTRDDGNSIDPHFELGKGVKTPEKYIDRIVITDGLPTKGIRGIMTSSRTTFGTDTNGNFANITYTDCIDPEENGTYQLRLDNLGKPIKKAFTKLPVYTQYFPLVVNGVSIYLR